MESKDVALQLQDAARDIAGLENPVHRDMEIKKVTATSGVSVQAFRAQVNLEIKQKRKATHSANELAGRAGVNIGTDRPIDGTFSELTDVMGKSKRFFSQAKNLAVLDDDSISIIPNADALNGKLVSCCDIYEENESGRSYSLLHGDMARAYLKSDQIRKFPEIVAYFKRPTLDSDFNQIQRGYHPGLKIFVACDLIQPKREMTTLLEGLVDMCFLSPADRANYISFLITPLVHRHFSSRVPMLIAKGNQPGVGKGEAIECVSIVREGKEERNITFISNDEEMEKRVCSVLLSGSTMLKFDNVKTSKNLPVIESSLIERTITDANPSFRILGGNVDLHFPQNNFQVTMTYNGGEMSQDLISRSVPVMLHYEGDTADRVFRHQDVRRYFTENRMTILAELLGMVENWREKGLPRARVRHRMQQWAEVVGGILEANGVKGFLSNVDGFQRESDPKLAEISELLKNCLEHEKFTAKELLIKAKRLGLFRDDFSGDVNHSRSIQFGKLLAGYVKRKIDIPGRPRILLSGPSRNSTVYWWETVGVEEDDTHPQQANTDTGLI